MVGIPLLGIPGEHLLHVERHLDRTNMFCNPKVVGEDSREEFKKKCWNCCSHFVFPRPERVAKRTPRHWSWTESSLQGGGFAELPSLGVLVKVASE